MKVGKIRTTTDNGILLDKDRSQAYQQAKNGPLFAKKGVSGFLYVQKAWLSVSTMLCFKRPHSDHKKTHHKYQDFCISDCILEVLAQP